MFFDEDHFSALESDEVVGEVVELLNAVSQP